jgi:hypothetical protein
MSLFSISKWLWDYTCKMLLQNELSIIFGPDNNCLLDFNEIFNEFLRENTLLEKCLVSLTFYYVLSKRNLSDFLSF